MTRHLVPVRVTAHLAAGIAQSAPWGIALDGLLASALWQQHKDTTPAGYSRAMDFDAPPPDLDLPLARCCPDAGPWHWAATCHHPAPGSRTDVHTWTGSLDHRDLELTTTGLPRKVSARQGRYRSRRMPLLVTTTPQVTWHAVGDPAAITDLLTPMNSIGKKRSTGEGHVMSWDITAAHDLDPLTAGHLHPDGTLGRPTPPACRERLEEVLGPVAGGGFGTAGIRPPYMHAARQHPLFLPALLDA